MRRQFPNLLLFTFARYPCGHDPSELSESYENRHSCSPNLSQTHESGGSCMFLRLSEFENAGRGLRRDDVHEKCVELSRVGGRSCPMVSFREFSSAQTKAALEASTAAITDTTESISFTGPIPRLSQSMISSARYQSHS